MNISKSDFKIIFHKMINSDNQIVNKYIKNLSLNGKTGDEQIDEIIKNYNSSYILRVINKINNKVLSGGNDQTSQEEPKKTEELKLIDTLSDTPVKEPMKVIKIVDSSNGTVTQVPVENKAIARNVVNPREQQVDSVTSSEMPSVIPTEQLSATSSEAPVRESETFMKLDSVTSSEMPPVIPTEQLSATSGVRDVTATTTSTEIPEPVTKSEISEIFIQDNKQKHTTLKMTVKKLIEQLKVKSSLLKQKESELTTKETEIDNRQKIIVQAEDDIRRKLEEMGKQVDELKKQKEQLVTEVEGLKNESVKLKDSMSEIEVDLNNGLALTETDSKPAQSLLAKIFG